MSNPNPNIWGAPETWIPAKIWQGVTGEGRPDIKACRAKSASFGGTDNEYIGTIERAVSNNVIEFAPIDNSIVTCGQNPTASNLGNIMLFTNKQDAASNKVPDKIITYNKPINWVFSSIYNANYYSANTNTWGGRIDVNNKKMCIAPEPEIGTKPNNYNPNMLITPIVYYQIRSLWGVIWVQEDNDTYGGGNWWSLEDWKNNHSDKPICQINFDLFGFSSYDGTNITVSRANNDMPDGSANGVSLLEPVNGITSYTSNVYNRVPQIMIANKLDSNYYNTDFTFYGFGWRSDWENGTIKSYTRQNTEHGWCLWQSIPYTAANYEKIMGMCACYGIPFSDSNTTTYPADFNDNRVCLPVIDDNGIATGEYTRGADNLTNPFAELDSVRDTNYDPNKNYDPNTYDNTTIFNVIGAGASLNKRYLLDGANVRKLSTDLFTICDTISENQTVWDNFDSKVKSEFLTQSPIDSIVSLIRLPFAPSHGTTKQAVKLGRYTASAEGYTISNMIHTITFNGIDIFPKFGNSFLDYEPYTKYELYVPFCGTIQLNAADVIDKTLNCRIIVDLLTGACTAYIMANSLCIETITGNVGAQLPITGLDTATINANIQSAEQNQKAAKWKYFASYLPIPSVQKSNLSDIVKNGDTTKRNLEQTHYELTHINTPMHTIGSASPVTGWASDLVLRLLIYYPVGNVIDSTGDTPKFNTAALTEFGNLNGFATCETGQLTNYHGFTTVSDADLHGIVAMDSELLEIRNLLQSGVYL